MHERVASDDVLQAARLRDGCCLIGLWTRDGCVPGFDAHHIVTRGAGGDDALPNLICACRKHHNAAHAGAYSAKQLRWLLAKYYGYVYEAEQLTPIAPAKPKKRWR
jgi:hypothetical protein